MIWRAFCNICKKIMRIERFEFIENFHSFINPIRRNALLPDNTCLSSCSRIYEEKEHTSEIKLDAGKKWNCRYRNPETATGLWSFIDSSQDLITRSRFFFAKFKDSSPFLSLFLYSPRQFEKAERFPIFHIYLETYFQVCISQRPLACYVMALSRQTARTFPGHRTSINYRSFHEQLHRFWKLPVFTRYSASRKNANRKHGKCWIRRQVSGN